MGLRVRRAVLRRAVPEVQAAREAPVTAMEAAAGGLAAEEFLARPEQSAPAGFSVLVVVVT